MRFPRLFPALGSLVALAAAVSVFAQAPALPAGSGHFRLVEASNGKTVGEASCTVTGAAGGYLIDSTGHIALAKFSYSFTNTNRTDRGLNIVRDQLTGTVNGKPVTFTMKSDPSGRQFDVSIVAQGKTTTNTLTRHLDLVLLPDLDPAAYLAMAHVALARAATPWIIIPKQNGILVPANYQQDPEAGGIFHGQPISLHHTSVLVNAQNGISVEIYYTAEGQLLEADLPEQNFYVIRDGFVLRNRPQYKPPQGSAPPPQGVGQNGPQQDQPQQ